MSQGNEEQNSAVPSSETRDELIAALRGLLREVDVYNPPLSLAVVRARNALALALAEGSAPERETETQRSWRQGSLASQPNKISA